MKPAGARKKRRKDNKEEIKWEKMEDIEAPSPAGNKKRERKLENMGNRRERRGNDIMKKMQPIKDNENVVKLSDSCRQSWL